MGKYEKWLFGLFIIFILVMLWPILLFAAKEWYETLLQINAMPWGG